MSPWLWLKLKTLNGTYCFLPKLKILGIPTILAINMSDRMKRKAISLDIAELEEKLETKIALN